MNNQKPFSIYTQILFTREGKTILQQFVRDFFSQWAEGSILRKIAAKLILLCVAPLTKIRSTDRSLEALLNDKQWWEGVGDSILHSIVASDMAVIKKYTDVVSTHAPAALGKVANDIWMHPAKVVTLLACIPSVANCMIRCANVTLQPLNNQAPDLLADVVTSLLHDIDAQSLGCTVNNLCEFVRKFDTGDELIKESASTPFEHSVKRMVGTVLSNLEDETRQQIFNSILSLKNKITNAVFESLQEHPDALHRLINFIIVNKIHNIQTVYTLLKNYNTQDNYDIPVEEIAHFINELLKFIIVVHAANKPLFDSILNRFAHTLDKSAFQNFINQAGNECFTALQPVLVQIFPFVLSCWTRLLQEEDESMQQARKAFARALLKGVEA